MNAYEYHSDEISMIYQLMPDFVEWWQNGGCGPVITMHSDSIDILTFIVAARAWEAAKRSM